MPMRQCCKILQSRWPAKKFGNLLWMTWLSYGHLTKSKISKVQYLELFPAEAMHLGSSVQSRHLDLTPLLKTCLELALEYILLHDYFLSVSVSICSVCLLKIWCSVEYQSILEQKQQKSPDSINKFPLCFCAYEQNVVKVVVPIYELFN